MHAFLQPLMFAHKTLGHTFSCFLCGGEKMQPGASGKWNHSTAGMQRRILTVSSRSWLGWSLSCREGLPELGILLPTHRDKAQSPALSALYRSLNIAFNTSVRM